MLLIVAAPYYSLMILIFEARKIILSKKSSNYNTPIFKRKMYH
eukprot:UN22733